MCVCPMANRQLSQSQHKALSSLLCQLSSASHGQLPSEAGLPLLISHQERLTSIPINTETSAQKDLLIMAVGRKLKH